MSTAVEDLAALVQEQQGDEVADFDQQVQDAAVGDADERMGGVLAAAAALWASAFGSTTAVGVGADLARLLRTVGEQVGKALAGLGERARQAVLEALPRALALGVDHARQFAAAAGHHIRTGTSNAGRVPATLSKEARRIVTAVEQQLAQAGALLSADPDRFSGVAAAVQVARAAVSRVRAAVSWLVQRTITAGTDAEAQRLDVSRVWVAELDACVRCAAYSGQVAKPGEDFEGGRSFDPQQRDPSAAPVAGPPLHPHCRCRTVPWSPSWHRLGRSLPKHLEKQAAVSIAEGLALPSESGAARIRAARTLLASGRRLPARAAAKARRALREGRFDRTR
ncbi:hypothetical protein [Streptomyces sp. CB03911]|uniref:hypothetical protein n=1 Tax=Streptomyces sp. CB03911 TaxID=1804758 RepID=UPI000939B79C|nr:hypothetical protein [Streptomyces sp. CB03911]OKI16621.1 hypothetical protein A6A07_11480 [Streptomyces sp. CB03911]